MDVHSGVICGGQLLVAGSDIAENLVVAGLRSQFIFFECLAISDTFI